MVYAGPKGRRQLPVSRDDLYEIVADGTAADCTWKRDFYAPFWRVSQELVLTPPPTMRAATLKAAIIEADDLFDEADYPSNIMKVLRSEFARLARKPENGHKSH